MCIKLNLQCDFHNSEGEIIDQHLKVANATTFKDRGEEKIVLVIVLRATVTAHCYTICLFFQLAVLSVGNLLRKPPSVNSLLRKLGWCGKNPICEQKLEMLVVQILNCVRFLFCLTVGEVWQPQPEQLYASKVPCVNESGVMFEQLALSSSTK